MLDRIQVRSNVQFFHIVLTDSKARELECAAPRVDVFSIRRIEKDLLPQPDLNLLASLEGHGIPTIHNMILGDRVLRLLPCEEVLAYATLLARRIKEILEVQKPDVVLGAFDSLHAGIGLAVSRSMGITWVAMNFTTIPSGLMAFSTEISPSALLPIKQEINLELKQYAAEILSEFIEGKKRTPVYVSEYSAIRILKNIPTRLKNLARRFILIISMQNDRYTSPKTCDRLVDYVRRTRNTLLLPNSKLLRVPPSGKFVFFALHMQPESTIDGWSPFYADQLHLIDQLVRAMPPNISLLVKLHISDANNYSPKQLGSLMKLPGLSVVHPTAPSRHFIEHAALIIGIQGTVCLEAALLGKPVLMFGDSPYLDFPSVSKVETITGLPAQIRDSLKSNKPSEENILSAFTRYVASYMPAMYNDWSRLIADDDIDRLKLCFEKLEKFIRDSKLASCYN